MTPAQKPCQTCKAFWHDIYKGDWCYQLSITVRPFWTGCVMHEEKEK